MNDSYGYQLSLSCGPTYALPIKSPQTQYIESTRLSQLEIESSGYQHFVLPDRPTEPSPPFSDTISQTSSQDSQASTWDNFATRTTTSTPASVYPSDETGSDNTFDFGQLTHQSLNRRDYVGPLTVSWLGADLHKHHQRHGGNYDEILSTTQHSGARSQWTDSTEDATELVPSFEQINLPIRPHVVPKVAGVSRVTALSSMVDSRAPATMQQQTASASRRREKLSSTHHCPPQLRRDTENTNSMVRCIVMFCTNLIQHIASDPEGSAASCSPNMLPLETFIKESLRRSKTSYSTLQIALYYLMLAKEKQCQQNVGVHRVMRCGRRLFLTALILASKYLQDRNYSARAWSKISGLPLQEINENERQYLNLITWDLHIPKDCFENWCNIVLSFGRADASHEEHWRRRSCGDVMSRQDHAYGTTRLNWWRESLSMLTLSMVRSHQSVTQVVQRIYKLRLHMFTNSLRCINIAQWATSTTPDSSENQKTSDSNQHAHGSALDGFKTAISTPTATRQPYRSNIHDLLTPLSSPDSPSDTRTMHTMALPSLSDITHMQPSSRQPFHSFLTRSSDEGRCPALRYDLADTPFVHQPYTFGQDPACHLIRTQPSQTTPTQSATCGLAKHTPLQAASAAVLSSCSDNEETYFSLAENSSYAGDSAYESDATNPDCEEYRKNGSKRKRASNQSLSGAEEMYKRARKFAATHNTHDPDFYMARRQGVVTASSIEDRLYAKIDRKAQRRAKPVR